MAGNKLNPVKKPVLNPLPPKQGTQPVVPPASPMTAPVQPVQPQVQQAVQQPVQGVQSSPMQEVLRRKRMLEI